MQELNKMQAVAMLYDYWPGEISGKKSWFIIVRQDILNKKWDGTAPTGKHCSLKLTIGLPYTTEEACFEAIANRFDPEHLFT